MQNKKTRNKKRGFTLVELVIVIAVIAVLSAILIPTFSNVINNANRTKDNANAKSMTTQLLTMATMDGIKSYTPGEARAYLRYNMGNVLSTKSKGATYWYNYETGNINVMTVEEALADPTAEPEQSYNGIQTFGYAAPMSLKDQKNGTNPEEKTPEQELYGFGTNKTIVYMGGDPFLDEIIDTITNLTMYAKLQVLTTENSYSNASIGEKMNDIHTQLESRISSSGYDSEEKRLIAEAVGKFGPANCAYFDNEGVYHNNTSQQKAFDNYFVTNGTTKVAKSQDQITINKDYFVFPAGTKVMSNSFEKITTGKTPNSVTVVEIPKANTASTTIVKQYVTDIVDKANNDNLLTQAQTILVGQFDSRVQGSDVETLISQVETAIDNQLSGPPASGGNLQFITDSPMNQIQYVTLDIDDYIYYQKEFRYQVEEKRNVTVNGTEVQKVFKSTEYIREGSNFKNLTDYQPGDIVNLTIKNSTDNLVSQTIDKEAEFNTLGSYPTDNGKTSRLHSVSLIPTYKISTSKLIQDFKDLGILNGETLNEKSVSITLYYESYPAYDSISGICLVTKADGTQVSYKIEPLVYLKRVSVVTVGYDVMAGLTDRKIVNVPDLSNSANMDKMKVYGLVKSSQEPVELTKLDSTAGANAGKYYYKQGSTTNEITEIIIEDNQSNVVFRQTIETKATTSGEKTQTK